MTLIARMMRMTKAECRMNDESHFTEGNQGNKDYEVGLNVSLSLPPLRSVNAISPTLKRAIIQPSETQKFPRTLVPVNFCLSVLCVSWAD